MMGNRLFADLDFFTFSDNEKRTILSKISQISDDALLSPDRTGMIEALVKQHELEQIEIESDEDKFTKNVEETTYSEYNPCFAEAVNTTGLQISWNVPVYVERTNLLYVQPTRHIVTSFSEQVRNNCLQLSIIVPLGQLDNDPTYAEKHFRERLKSIRQNTEYLNNDIESFNKQLEQFIVQVLNEREKKANILKKAYEAMKIPLKKNNSAPSVIPIARKLIRPELPTAKKEKTASITNEDYTHILGVIRHVGASFERTRTTYSVHGEEALRDIILSHLNGHYKGIATGETFRVAGKTDINIEFENRAAFIGECKIWSGKEVFNETIAQILSYNTWRDSKNAIILFNKNNKDFSAIQKQIPELIKQTEGFQRLNPTNDGEWEFVLRPRDTNDEKTIHIFAFDIFCENKVKENKK